MAKRKRESNGLYFLKVVLFFVMGTIWIRFGPDAQTGLGIPIGLMLGVLFANHEHFQIDQKIEFALLFIAAVLSYIFPIGAVLVL